MDKATLSAKMQERRIRRHREGGGEIDAASPPRGLGSAEIAIGVKSKNEGQKIRRFSGANRVR